MGLIKVSKQTVVKIETIKISMNVVIVSCENILIGEQFHWKFLRAVQLALIT